jgi:hypothetical protein
VAGQRVGYVRVSTLDQNEKRQLEGQLLDRVVTDKASGRDTARPQLTELLRFAREGDTVVVHSMDRLARNLDDRRALVRGLTRKGVRLEFDKESLVFTGEDSPTANLMLSVIAPSPNSNAPSSGNARGKASPWPSSAAPIKGGRRPSHRNGPPSWPSARTMAFRKPSLPGTSGSAGGRHAVDRAATAPAPSGCRMKSLNYCPTTTALLW